VDIDRIKTKDLADMVRDYASQNKVGQFACYNPHWWIHLCEDNYYAFEYFCCDADDCNAADYEKYDTIDELIKDQLRFFDDGHDDWCWIEKAELSEAAE